MARDSFCVFWDLTGRNWPQLYWRFCCQMEAILLLASLTVGQRGQDILMLYVPYCGFLYQGQQCIVSQAWNGGERGKTSVQVFSINQKRWEELVEPQLWLTRCCAHTMLFCISLSSTLNWLLKDEPNNKERVYFCVCTVRLSFIPSLVCLHASAFVWQIVINLDINLRT